MLKKRMSVDGLGLFQEIMNQEEIIHNAWKFTFFASHRANQIFTDVVQLAEIAKASTVPRSYLRNYNLDSSEQVFESVSAHTNLCHAILGRALDELHFHLDIFNIENGTVSSQIMEEISQYTREEVFEAITIHDLPENDFGDWPDNNSCDENAKAELESDYFGYYTSLYSRKYPLFRQHVVELVQAMNDPNSIIGQILYLTDKVSAIICALTYDLMGYPPMMHQRSGRASAKDRKEMAICDYNKDGYCKASEMWTMDYFVIRHLVERDFTGYFTSLIVMFTLMVNDNNWYKWRTNAYLEPEKITPPTIKVPII